MATEQSFPVVPPGPTDGKLLDFSEVVQRNLSTLFEVSHTHVVRTTAPTLSELEIGVPLTVNLSGVYYIYVKVSTTQLARVALTLV